MPKIEGMYTTGLRDKRKTEYFPIIGGEIKELNDAKGTIGGYLNYINNIDYGDDRTMPGAFRKTLQDSYARKSAQGLDFLWPYLWNHDYSIIPPGGIYDADEDRKGLYTKTQFNLDIQLGRELYASFKMGTMKKQSMGYKAIQVDWVKEEGRSIRNLLEVSVREGSAVVFPMNDLAQVDNVKNHNIRSIFAMSGYNTKGSASGKTSWPLAERGVSWDKGAAHKDIMAYATSGDSVNWSKAAECHFWVAKSPPENWGDCKFPFVAKSGGSMKAIPAAIFNGAARLDGANIDDKDGVKAKVASYYRRMKMTPPWEKGKSMDIWSKDYAESYMQTNQQDWVSDLWNLWYPLRNEILTAFQTGDTVVEDVTKALEQFSTATLAYIQEGIALDMNEYLQPNSGDSSMPMMMSSDDNPETKEEEKAGRMISAANHAKLKQAADGIKEHVATIHSVLKQASPAARQNALQGYQLYSGNEPPEQKEEEHKDEAENEDEDEATILNKMRSMVDDLATTLQFQNAERGI
jgi:HK97 family phage prohead protease